MGPPRGAGALGPHSLCRAGRLFTPRRLQTGPVTEGELEAIRERYRPRGAIRVLMLGESPPRGRGFFYLGESSLYRFTAPVLREECGFPDGVLAFLSRFAQAGFFLDDFSPRRGDKPAARPHDRDVQ